MVHSISRVVENDDSMAAVWQGGEETSLPYLWLRDNCGCSECRVVQTTEKRFHIFRVAREIRPWQVTIERPGWDDEELAIVWPDGHRTRYGSLEIHCLTGEQLRTRDHVRYWDSSFQPRRYDFGQFLGDDRTAADLIEEFLRTGACVLVDAPTEPDSSEQLAARLGPVREVVFDRIHNVSARWCSMWSIRRDTASPTPLWQSRRTTTSPATTGRRVYRYCTCWPTSAKGASP